MREIRASVAMAVYNGEKYICEQIDSILKCMDDCDELVISYDKSTDRTKEIIDSYSQKDCRVRVIINEVSGVQNNFNNAVTACMGKYIFLSDQDDLWIGDKINEVVRKFEQTGADVVVHDGYMVNGQLQKLPGTIFERYGTYDHPIRNIVKCTYWGCCMAFRADLRNVVCPFPNQGGVGHDWWLGIIAGFAGTIARLDKCLIMHRLHGENVSTEKRRALRVVIMHRSWLIYLLLRKWWELIRRKLHK